MRKLFAAILICGLAAPVTAQSRRTLPATGIPWTCGLDNIGNTLTKCVVSFQGGAAGAAEMRLFITDIVASSTTATGSQFLLQYGTGTNCGTGTTSLFPSAASAVRFGYPGNQIVPLNLRLLTPTIIPAGKDLCVLAAATNTITIQINGYAAP